MVIWTSLAIIVMYLGFILVFWLGSECVMITSRCPSQLQNKTYSAGTLIQIFYALFLPAISLNQLTPSFYKIIDGKKAAERIYSIIDRVPEIRSKENAIVP
jgi:ATP-binding cassette, subfamily B (MDR/TAP), member 1